MSGNLLANLLQESPQQFLDNNGVPLAGGFIYTYATDGLTPKATYTSAAATTLNSNPVVLDGNGRATIYGSGAYVLTVTDALNNQITTGPTQDPLNNLGVTGIGEALLTATTQAGARAAIGAAGLPVPVAPWGTIFPFASVTAPSGYASCYGQAISRTTYPNLFAAIGTAWGAGDGATTFNLPDLRGRVIAGQDGMGGVPAMRLTTLSIPGTGGGFASGGGDQSPPNMQLTATVTDPGHTHALTHAFIGGSIIAGYNSTPYDLYQQDFGMGQPTVVAATTGISVTIAGPYNGAGLNVQPTLVMNYIIQLG